MKGTEKMLQWQLISVSATQICQ